MNEQPLKRFLENIDHERIVAAIQGAEARSRGEIRVHATDRAAEDVQAEAARVFEKLGMTATAERNGVLIYVAPRSHRFAIIGDTGIHERCGAGFWKEIAAAMEHDFRDGRFTDGLVKGIARAGESLAVHFPRTAAPDVDELPNRVSED
jgi:uncharacterized membrane protein